MKRILLFFLLISGVGLWLVSIMLRGQSYSGTNSDAIRLLPNGVIAAPYGISAGSITNTSITSAFLSTDASGRHVGKLVQSGLTTLLLTDTSKAITFSTPMGGTNYSVAFTPSIAISSSFGVTNKTVNGFTILSVGVIVGVEWEARER